MRTVVLHVGMHKTGTTSIQQSLNGFAESGIKYLALDTANHTAPIRAAFSDHIQFHALKLKSAEELAALKQSTLEQMNQQLADRQFSKFIISGEGIVRLTAGALQELKRTLLQHVDSIQVFAYMREPIGYSASAFQQRVRMGGYQGYELTRADYRTKFEKFMEVFGRENFSAKVFARNSLQDASVVVDFCTVWGIPFDPRREVRSNEGLSEAALKLMHMLNRTEVVQAGGDGARRARMRLIDMLADHFPGKFVLDPRFHSGTIDVEDIAWLREQCGIDFTALSGSQGPWALDEFREYLDDIDPSVTASYRDLLKRQKIACSPDDAPDALLTKHFEALKAEAVKKRRPKLLSGLRAIGGLTPR